MFSINVLHVSPDEAFTSEYSLLNREAMEAASKAAAYAKKHAAGETDEAKSDLARLKAIRAKREADKAAREAREEEGGEEKKKKDKVGAWPDCGITTAPPVPADLECEP